ncbi:hypothetical protein NC651_006431 [Populus alba x Populus x berolinensis]|nr:hypothetical protein NC651_006431 [Populus alba x Populus x berolinensis]
MKMRETYRIGKKPTRYLIMKRTLQARKGSS